MINIGQYIEELINWMMIYFSALFDALNLDVGSFISGSQHILLDIPFYLTIATMVLLVQMKAGRGVAAFTLSGSLLIYGMDFWEATMQTLALVLSSTYLTLIAGIPIGVWTVSNNRAGKVIHPILDLMQAMPVSIYPIPAVLFFGLGAVLGVFATIIFAMPPVIRLTGLGVHQIPKNAVEASRSFRVIRWQLLYGVQLPLALSTILTRVGQMITISLSMVIIAATIATGGLGKIVLKGITQMKIGLSFEGGIAIVILAIILDRITQGMVRRKGRK